MRLLEYFPRAYVINLPERSERRRQTLRMLARVGLHPGPGEVEFFAAIRPNDQGEFRNVGVRGCFLSHLTVLRKALEDGLDRVLVMEDDLEIDPGLTDKEDRLVTTLSSQPWGMAYLGHRVDEIQPSSQGLVLFAGSTIGAHFYAVARPVLGELVAYLDAVLTRPGGHPDGGPMDFDGALSTFRARTKVPTLFAAPSLGWQRSSRSDVSEPAWFDSLPVARQLVGILRRARNPVTREVSLALQRLRAQRRHPRQ